MWTTLGILGFILIVGSAILIRSGWRPSKTTATSTTPAKTGGGEWKLLLAGCGCLTLFGVASWVAIALLFSYCGGSAKPNKDHSADTPLPMGIVEKVGKLPTLYKFSDYANHCVSLDIRIYDFNWYPKGGRVTVFPPSGKSFIDTPGVDITTHHDPGLWRWCAKDLGATGVEVWQ